MGLLGPFTGYTHGNNDPNKVETADGPDTIPHDMFTVPGDNAPDFLSTLDLAALDSPTDSLSASSDDIFSDYASAKPHGSPESTDSGPNARPAADIPFASLRDGQAASDISTPPSLDTMSTSSEISSSMSSASSSPSHSMRMKASTSHLSEMAITPTITPSTQNGTTVDTLVVDSVHAPETASITSNSVSPRNEEEITSNLEESKPGDSGENLNSNNSSPGKGTGARSKRRSGEESPKKRTFSHQTFVEKMKQPQASDLVRQLKTFVDKVNQSSQFNGSKSKHVKQLHEFIDGVYRNVRKNPLWKGAGAEEMDSVLESLEKFVMCKLYPRLYGASSKLQELDSQLAARIFTLQFLQPAHLDIPGLHQDDSALKLAQKELRNMESFKAPRDKVVCLLNCCKIIINLLKRAKITENKAKDSAQDAAGASTATNPTDASPPAPQQRSTLPSADDFLPILIYTVVKAAPKNLYLDLEFVSLCRHPSKLVGEPDYFLTNLRSAVMFILNVDASCLTMEKATFDEYMAKGEAALAKKKADEAEAQAQEVQQDYNASGSPESASTPESTPAATSDSEPASPTDTDSETSSEYSKSGESHSSLSSSTSDSQTRDRCEVRAHMLLEHPARNSCHEREHVDRTRNIY